MNQKELEELSALVDDEHAGGIDGMMGRYAGNEELRRKWYRYHLIGEVMRDELPEKFAIDLADRVRASIDREPAILAPAPWRQRWLRPAIGLAVAASVAGITVYGLQREETQQTGVPMTQGQLAGLSTPSVSPPLRRASVPAQSEQRQTPTSPAVAIPIPATARFNSYLVNHLEQRSDFGMIPYVRVVTYDSAQ